MTKEEIMEMTPEELLDKAILFAESKYHSEKNLKELTLLPNKKKWKKQ